MKILQSKMTETQTSFPTNFGSKLGFILSFFFPERLHCFLHDIFNAPTWTTTIISLKPCALYAETSFPTNFGGKLGFILCFFFPERLHSLLLDIFNAPTWTTTIISLKPCALYAEFQHFILRFSKISLLLQILLKRGDRG